MNDPMNIPDDLSGFKEEREPTGPPEEIHIPVLMVMVPLAAAQAPWVTHVAISQISSVGLIEGNPHEDDEGEECVLSDYWILAIEGALGQSLNLQATKESLVVIASVILQSMILHDPEMVASVLDRVDISAHRVERDDYDEGDSE